MLTVLPKGERPVRAILPLIILIAGCSAHTYTVRLANSSSNAKGNSVSVLDGRADKSVYMNGISFNNDLNVYALDPIPPIQQVLQGDIESELGSDKFLATVTITSLEIKNKVGFAKADQLGCTIESSVKVGSSSENVKTFSQNNMNMSPRVQTSGKVILDQCLNEHASDVVKAIHKSASVP